MKEKPENRSENRGGKASPDPTGLLARERAPITPGQHDAAQAAMVPSQKSHEGCGEPKLPASLVPCAEWARCKHWIEAALPYCYGTHTIEDVERQIAEHRLQFWPGNACAVITEIVEYPRLKALNFFLVGGDLSELLEQMEPAIVAWAKAMGCTRVAQTGRRGWGRALAPLGYQTTLSVMLKEI